MNQRYRNDDDLGRRSNDDDIGNRYAQPSPDTRFERDRGPRNQGRHREQNDYSEGQANSNGWNNYGPRDYSSRAFGPSNNHGSGDFGANSHRGGDAGRGSWDGPSRSSGQWQGGRGNFGASSQDDAMFRNNQDTQFSPRFSRHHEYAGGYRDYGSNGDYSHPSAGAFADENPFGGRARPLDGRESGSFGGGSNGYNGRQAAGFYADTSQQRRGEHFGKGPKGYQRSDERIREDVCDRLAQDDALDARNITVTTSKGEVTLEGSVPDRFSKHRAEDIVDSISGVTDISNRLKVDKGFLDDISERITGNQEHSGHSGERPKESKNGHSAVSRQ